MASYTVEWLPVNDYLMVRAHMVNSSPYSFRAYVAEPTNWIRSPANNRKIQDKPNYRLFSV